MKFGSIHMCCVIVAILILFFLLNRFSMYTEGDSRPMTCTCTSASDSQPANTVAPASDAMMMPTTTTTAMMPSAMQDSMMIGN
jgi:hypothetical protein